MAPPAYPAVPVTPIRRLLSVAMSGFTVLIAVGLIFGAQTAGLGWLRLSYVVVIFGIQALFVLALTMALRPPGIPVVTGVGLVAAVVADAMTVLPSQPELLPLAYVAAGGFLAAVAGQLVRPEGRIRFTESVWAALVVSVGVTAYATLVVLTRLPGGTQTITVSLAAAGVAVTVARFIDAFVPWPRLSPQVPRGAPGVVLGPMLGTGLAAFLGSYLVGFDPTTAALAGLVAAVAAVLADLSVGYAEAARRLSGEPPTMWIARHLQGPMMAFAVAAPLAYATCALFFGSRF